MCPNCKTCKEATAHPLTRTEAEKFVKRIAADLRAESPSLSVQGSEEEAMRMILLKRPTLVAQCDGCGYEWFE
jgi:ribosomal protein L44E